MKESLTAFNANPYVFVFSAVAIGAVLVYGLFYVVNQIGLEARSTVATVVDKRFTEAGKSYMTKSVNGRTWVQPYDTPETYALTLKVGNERTVALVSKEFYESLSVGDTVNVKARQTRITGKLQVVKVTH